IFIDEGAAHTVCMLRVNAEDDGFLKRVTALAQILSDFMGYEFGAVVYDKSAVKIFLVVETVFNLVAEFIGLAALGTVAFNVHVNVNFDNFVRSKESVLNTLFQRVGVNRRAEIVDVGNVFCFLGRGGEADLGGAREVIENLTPCGISGCAAAMALVNNDEIKEVAGELFIKLLALFRSGDGLIEREVDLKGGINAAVAANGCGDGIACAVVTLNGFRAGAELGH